MLKEFLDTNGWSDATRTPITPDWSARRYWRLEHGGKTAILLACPPDDSPEATPGHKLSDLVRINAYLRGIGLSAPETLAVDYALGYALLEDFGDTALDADNSSHQETVLDVLCHLHTVPKPADIALPTFTDTHIPKKLLAYGEAVLKLSGPALDKFYAACVKMMQEVPQNTFCHVDFRAGNLQILPERRGVQSIGLLDTQGSVWGAQGYDLMTFVEDIRRPTDIDEAQRQHWQESYCARLGLDIQDFGYQYARWRFVFRAGVLGQLMKRNAPDQQHLIANLAKKVQRDASHPALHRIVN